MRATAMYGTGDVRVEDMPDPRLREPTDAVVRVLRAGICGSDLWPYPSMPLSPQGRRMGHEFLGVVADTGSEVSGLNRGDLVVTPFLWADNTCDFCREGLHTCRRHGGRYGSDGVDGGQGEAVRVLFAQGTVVKLPIGIDEALLASLLTLSDVFCTGHHCECPKSSALATWAIALECRRLRVSCVSRNHLRYGRFCSVLVCTVGAGELRNGR